MVFWRYILTKGDTTHAAQSEYKSASFGFPRHSGAPTCCSVCPASYLRNAGRKCPIRRGPAMGARKSRLNLIPDGTPASAGVGHFLPRRKGGCRYMSVHTVQGAEGLAQGPENPNQPWGIGQGWLGTRGPLTMDPSRPKMSYNNCQSDNGKDK